MQKLVLIAATGGVGSLVRYAMAGWVQRSAAGTFPTGTLAVNVVGCLLIGLATALFTGPHLIREEYRIAILIGLLGGFTTFSTFAWETVALLNDGQHLRALVNLIGSNGLGLAAAWMGYRVGQQYFGV